VAERRGLGGALDVAIPAAIGGALALALVAWPAGGDRATTDDRLLGDVDVGTLRALRIAPVGGPAIEVAWPDGGGGPAALTAPIAAPVDDVAARELVGTLEYLRAVRREPRAAAHGLAAPRARLTARFGARAVELVVGAEVPGQDRAWLGVGAGSPAYLVDGFQIRALLASVEELRARRPLAGLPLDALRIAAPGAALELRGDDVVLDGVARPIDPAARAELRGALEAVELVRFDAPAPGGSETLSVTAGGTSPALRAFAACDAPPATTWVESRIGAGCVADGSLAALAGWARAPWRVVRRSPFTLDPDRLTAAAFTLDGVRTAATVEPRTREPIGQFAVAMATRIGAPVPLADAPEVGAVELDGDGRVESAALFRLPDGGLAFGRAGDATGFRLEPAAAALLAPMSLRPLDLIEREPTDVVAIELSRRGRVVGALRRGELLEEWIATGNAEDLDGGAAAVALARLRAAAWVAPVATPAHGFAGDRLELELPAEDAGPPARLGVELGADAPEGGCYGRLLGAPEVFRLDATRCSTLRALLVAG
jgi:hypothetical protein